VFKFSKEEKEVIKKNFLDKISRDVTIYSFWTKEREGLNEMARVILSELEKLSNKIKVKEREFDPNGELEKKFNINFAPCLVAVCEEKYFRFYGFPGGYEFPVFLDVLAMISSEEMEVGEEVKKIIENIEKPVKVKIFVTVTCPYSPIMTHWAYTFAILNNKIDVDVYDVGEFQGIAEEYNVRTVPKTILDDKLDFEGAIPPKVFAYCIKSISKEK